MIRKKRPSSKKVCVDNYVERVPITGIMRSISERLDERLREGSKRGQVIGHNLEYGLGSENVVRTLLHEILPIKYGVAKGKLVNITGQMTRHLDIIIYDRINYPTLFLDEHQNQVLPIESAYKVIEVKSQTSASALKDAFQNLASVSTVAGKAPGCSTNELVDYVPPWLSVLSFQDPRSLETIRDNYLTLSQEFARDYSFSHYSKKSPGYKERTGDCYLVSEIIVLGKGSVYHMLDGRIAIGRWGPNTFTLFFTTMLSTLAHVKLTDSRPNNYLNWLKAGSREIYERDSKPI